MATTRRTPRKAAAPAEPLASLRGVVTRVVYPKPGATDARGWTIALLRPAEGSVPPEEQARIVPNGDGTVSICGTAAQLRQHDEVTLTGRWETPKDPIYADRLGRQFKFASLETARPADELGVAAWLATNVDGVGPTWARRIVEAWGHGPGGLAEVWTRLAAPDAAVQLEALGLHRDAATAAATSFGASAGNRETDAWLRGLGCGPTEAQQVIAAFGAETRAVLESNPYRLMEVERWGFLKADAVAQALRVPPGSAGRVRAAIVHTLQEAAAGQGHTYLPLYTPREIVAGLRAGKKLHEQSGCGLLDRLAAMGVDVRRALEVLAEMDAEARTALELGAPDRADGATQDPTVEVTAADPFGHGRASAEARRMAAARALHRRRALLVLVELPEGDTGTAAAEDGDGWAMRGGRAWLLPRWEAEQEAGELLAGMLGEVA